MFPSSSSRMYPSTAMVESGGCFHDNVALLFWVQHSSSWSMGAAGTEEGRNQARLQQTEIWKVGRTCMNTHWIWFCSAWRPAQYLSFINSIMNIWIHNTLIKGCRIMNINTPNFLHFLSDLPNILANTCCVSEISYCLKHTLMSEPTSSYFSDSNNSFSCKIICVFKK